MNSSQEMILEMMRARGRADALDLRARSADMDGTALIAEEDKVPAFDPQRITPAGPGVRRCRTRARSGRFSSRTMPPIMRGGPPASGQSGGWHIPKTRAGEALCGSARHQRRIHDRGVLHRSRRREPRRRLPLQGGQQRFFPQRLLGQLGPGRVTKQSAKAAPPGAVFLRPQEV